MNCLKVSLTGSVLLLAACGGGGGNNDRPDPTPSPTPTASPAPTPGQAICQSIGGGAATVQTEMSNDCAGCAIGQPESAIDADLASVATLSIPVGGTLTVRGTAQSGVAFPAGLSVGAFVGKPSDTTDGSFEITVTAYLGETEVESQVVYARVGQVEATTGRTVITDDGNFYGISSISSSFDSIKVEVARTGVVSGADFPLFELCTRE